MTFADNLEKERLPHETVPFSVFTEEIKNIWSEIKAIRENLVEPHQLKENEKERNGNQEIHALQQKNQDLQNEICMLKDQLREQNNVLKNISEERDSYKTALQIMTKEINAHKEKDSPSQPVSADPDTEQGGWSTQQNTRHNRRSSRSTKSSSNSGDSHSGANNNNEHARKPVTVIAGDSIIQHIRGWSISRSNKVVVKSFPGASIEDMEDFVKPLLRKKPDNVVLHIGTNDLNTQEPRLTAEGIVNLAFQIEGDAPETNLAISGLIARADDKDGKVLSVNKILKKFCRQNHWNFIEHNNINQTHLNRGGLHLSKSGSALLAQNFCKHIDYVFAVWEPDQIPYSPKSADSLDFGQSSQNTHGKSVFGRGLVMAFLNINSLVSHIDDLRIFMSQSKGIDILAINETKLDSTIKDNEIHLPGYDVVRKDRENNGRHGGGVCIYVRSNINFQIRADLSPSDIECLTIEISRLRSKPFLVSTWYRPPQSSPDLFAVFERVVDKVDAENLELYLLGDLNCDLLPDSVNANSSHLLNIMDIYGLTQLITEPTRVTQYSRTLIDLCLTNSPDKICNSGVVNIGISDHCVIFLTRKISHFRSFVHKTAEVRQLKNFNEDEFLRDLRMNEWNRVSMLNNPNEMWNFWKHLLMSVIDKHNFNNHFTSIGQTLAREIPTVDIDPLYYVKPSDRVFSFERINVQEVVTLVKGIDGGKVTGLDNIPCKLLKMAADVVAPSLTCIFNQSLFNNYPAKSRGISSDT